MAGAQKQIITDTNEVPDRFGYEAGVHEIESVPEDSPSAGIARLWRIWERRRLLARIAWRSLLVATVVVYLIPVRYESTTRFIPSEQNQSGALLAALASTKGGGSSASPGFLGIAGDLLGMKSSGALLVALLRSRTVQDNLVHRFDLRKVYFTGYDEVARKTLDSRTDITEDRKSQVITIKVTDHDKKRAQLLTQAYVEELNLLLAQVNTSAAHRERIFIEQRLTQVKSDLEDAEKKFSSYASKNTALDIKEQTRAMVDAAAVLQGQMIAAQSQLQGLQQIYTPNNVRVRSLQAQVAELQKKLLQLGGSDAALQGDSSGSEDAKLLYPPIRKLPLLGVEWADLYRNMKVQETVFELLTEQYELTRLQEARDTPVVSLVDPANLPERKSFPPRVLLILSATILSVIISAFVSLGSDRWQEIPRDDPRRMLARSMWTSALNQGRKVHRYWPFKRFRREAERKD